ncbi:hypothetical protein S7S_16440 [Isoalcanivorax pacificus W11-5]|uniref:Uncharacterized protein n=1 Tax=Isoalcanivorax pacificus W11-5 TaxID=391936 RepID=A0A0B4XSH2_9GAMM|nr:hypothetical protein [Isoalcanivorax pacificus]AJD49700.1 hypothetical protein S7S_16440 [Isoalcanivorax pacificus W11-5]
MEEIVADFSAINDLASLVSFVRKYGLETKEHPDTFVVNTHEGQIHGMTVEVVHRWRDRCRAFQVRPDGNNIELKIADEEGKIIFSSTVSYLDDI